MLPHILFFDLDKEKIRDYREILCNVPNVSFYHGMLSEVVDKYVPQGIVSPANSFGIMTGGIDTDIARMFPDVEMIVKNQIQRLATIDSSGRAFLPVGQTIIVPTKRFDKSDKFLVVCPTMFLPKNIQGTDNVLVAVRGMLLSLHARYPASTIIACPCMGTGVGGLTGRISAEQVLKAFYEYYKRLNT
jgi:O-acetyl-ADP-ribose deacetylase (regulator of RNase III)